MLTRLRCRLSSEGGISLVETLVAIMILSISMLAMLNTLVVSAHATLDQRMRAMGTRVATAELERLRSAVWTSTTCEPSCTQTVQADNNQTYTILSTVSPHPTVPQLKQIATQVTWQAGTTTRSQTLRSSVTSGEAAAETVATEAYLTLALAPNPVRVFENTCVLGYWCPAAPLVVTATVEGTSYSGQIQLAWTGDDGVPRTLLMSKSGTTWTGSVAPAQVLVTFPDPALLERDVVFTVTAPGMPSLPAATYTLATLGYDDVALSLNVSSQGVADPVKRSQVRVDWQNDTQQCGNNSCKNLDTLTLWVTNVAPDATSVVLNWSQPVAQSLTLVKYASISGVWYAQASSTGPSSRRFYPGPPGTPLNQLPVVATVRKTVGGTTTVLMQSALSLPVWTPR